MSLSPLRVTSEQPTGPLPSTSPNKTPAPVSSLHSSPVDTLASAASSPEQIPLPPTVVEQAHSSQETNTPHQNPPLPDANPQLDNLPVLDLGFFSLTLADRAFGAFRTAETFVRNHQARLEQLLAVDHPDIDPELLGSAIIVSILDRNHSILSVENQLKLNQL